MALGRQIGTWGCSDGRVEVAKWLRLPGRAVWSVLRRGPVKSKPQIVSNAVQGIDQAVNLARGVVDVGRDPDRIVPVALMLVDMHGTGLRQQAD